MLCKPVLVSASAMVPRNIGPVPPFATGVARQSDIRPPIEMRPAALIGALSRTYTSLAQPFEPAAPPLHRQAEGVGGESDLERMLVKFVLTMEDLLVGDRHIDELEFGWTGDLSQEEILNLSRKWITTQNFLTERMDGLDRVGESSLTIEPVDPQARME